MQSSGRFNKAAALKQYQRESAQYAAILGGVQPMILAGRLRSRGFRPYYRVRAPAQSRPQAEAMCAKLRAAAGARTDNSTVIIARTDARGVNDFDTAVDRARQYVAAGADWIFPEALATREEFAAFAKAVDVPLVANMTEFGKSPLLSFAELDEMGYRVVLYPVTLLRVAMKAAEAMLGILASEGSQ